MAALIISSRELMVVEKEWGARRGGRTRGEGECRGENGESGLAVHMTLRARVEERA